MRLDDSNQLLSGLWLSSPDVEMGWGHRNLLRQEYSGLQFASAHHERPED